MDNDQDFCESSAGFEKYKCHEIGKVAQKLASISIDQLRPGPYQHRKTFASQSMAELAGSIKRSGRNVVPIIVRPDHDGDGYIIIAGERRWRATQAAGLHSLLCIVGDFNEIQCRFIAAAENLQRESLNPIEEALAYQEIVATGLSHEQIAAEVGKSRAHVSNYLRLLSLSFSVRELLAACKLSASQARPLCSLQSSRLQQEIATLAVDKGWSVRQISARVAAEQEKVTQNRTSLRKGDVDVDRLMDLVSTTTGYPCIIQKSDSGRWRVGFSMTSTEEMEGLLSRLGINVDD